MRPWPPACCCAPLSQEFASWRTLNLLADEAARAIPGETDEAHRNTLLAIQNEVVRQYARQLAADGQKLKDAGVDFDSGVDARYGAVALGPFDAQCRCVGTCGGAFESFCECVVVSCWCLHGVVWCLASWSHSLVQRFVKWCYRAVARCCNLCVCGVGGG